MDYETLRQTGYFDFLLTVDANMSESIRQSIFGNLDGVDEYIDKQGRKVNCG